MIGHLGMYQTLAIAMTVNLLVALGAWRLLLRLPPAQAAPSRHPEATAPTRAEAYGLVLLVCAVSGFAALAAGLSAIVVGTGLLLPALRARL